MSTSKFQDVRAAFAALITARFIVDGVEDVSVWEYEPRPATVTREDQVWVGRIRVDQEPLSMGGANRKVDETLTIDLAVRAPRSGADLDDQKLAEQRAETIFASVENAVRADGTVGGSVMFIQVDSFESVPMFDDLGAVGLIDAVFTAEANI